MKFFEHPAWQAGAAGSRKERGRAHLSQIDALDADLLVVEHAETEVAGDLDVLYMAIQPKAVFVRFQEGNRSDPDLLTLFVDSLPTGLVERNRIRREVHRLVIPGVLADRRAGTAMVGGLDSVEDVQDDLFSNNRQVDSMKQSSKVKPPPAPPMSDFEFEKVLSNLLGVKPPAKKKSSEKNSSGKSEDSV